MCKNSRYALVRYDYEHDKAHISILPCKAWACGQCAEEKRREHQRRIIYATKEHAMANCTWAFLTITSHERVRGDEDSLALIARTWPAMRKRIAREYGKFEYVMVFERHKRGGFHAHLLVSVAVRTKWLRLAARQLGLGYMAKAIVMKSPSSSGKYLSKYLSKCLSDGAMPKRFKRVRYSQGFPKPPELRYITQYEVIKIRDIGMWKLGLAADGYTVVLSAEASEVLDGLLDVKRKKVYA